MATDTDQTPFLPLAQAQELARAVLEDWFFYDDPGCSTSVTYDGYRCSFCFAKLGPDHPTDLDAPGHHKSCVTFLARDVLGGME